jgi:hypothetical protein
MDHMTDTHMPMCTCMHNMCMHMRMHMHMHM